MIFERKGYDGTVFGDFYVAKGRTDGPGWFIYGRDVNKYGTFPDGRGRYIKLCGWKRMGKARKWDGIVRLGWPTKRAAEEALISFTTPANEKDAF